MTGTRSPVCTKPVFFMKTFFFSLCKGAKQLHTYNLLLTAFTITLFYEMNAQVAPPVEWTFATPAITSGYGPKADWAYSLTQTSDKGVLVAGFVEDASFHRKPTLYKYDPFKKTVIWKSVMFPGNQAVTQFGNSFYDVFEFDDGGGNAYYSVGTKTTSNAAGLRLIIAKVHPEDGSAFSGYPKVIQLNIGGTIACRGYSMAPIISNNTFDGYMISGYIDNGSIQAVLIKLDENGDLDTGFGIGGYAAFSFTGYDESRFWNFTPVHDSGELLGYVATGWVKEDEEEEDEDILVVRTDLDGDEVWSNVITRTELNTALYDDGNLAPWRCQAPDYEANRGFDIKIGPDGDFIISAQVDFYQIRRNEDVDILCDAPWAAAYVEYTEFSSTLLKINENNGTVEWANFVRRFTGLDFFPALEIAGSTAFICGSVNDDDESLAVEGIVIAYDLDDPDIIWEKKFSVRDDAAQSNCIFDLALTDDGGIIVCGNNEVSGDDFILAKLRTSCQLEETFDITDGVTISGNTIWNTNKKVMGTVRIVSGGHLTIKNGAVISFANTYATNDIQDIADGEADYTKIIVEEGGKLTLDECTLKGLNACGENWMWEGIEVWGTPGLPQTAINRGYVELQGGAIVENAIVGILADRKRYNANGRGLRAAFVL